MPISSLSLIFLIKGSLLAILDIILSIRFFLSCITLNQMFDFKITSPDCYSDQVNDQFCHRLSFVYSNLFCYPL